MRKKILVVTAMYGRHDLTKIVLHYYAEIKRGFEMQLLCVGSEGEKSKSLAEECGWDYIEAKNNPVSQKFNALFKESEKYDYDFMVLIGSDDLISPEIFQYYERTVTKETKHLLGLKDLYFYSIQNDEAVHFQGYPPPSPKTIGAGRVFSRWVMERMNFTPWNDEKVNRGLDSSCTVQMRKRGIEEIAIPMMQTGGVAVDIKHPLVSLTNYKYLQNHPIADVSILDNAFHCMRYIKALRWKEAFDEKKQYQVRVMDQSRPDFDTVRTIQGKAMIESLILGKFELISTN
jgi:hypothetical protein